MSRVGVHWIRVNSQRAELQLELEYTVEQSRTAMPTLSRPETAVIGAAIESVPLSMVTAPGEKPGSLLVMAGAPYSAV